MAVLLIAAAPMLGGCASVFGEGGALPGFFSSVPVNEPNARVPDLTLGSAVIADPRQPLDPNDDLALGRRHFAEMNYGLSEQHFRRAVEKSTGADPRDAEAWLGLAASYDRLRRFDLADRAYGQAIKIAGPAPEILNNQGYSFLLRGDRKQARAVLTRAAQIAPDNPQIRNNLALIDRVGGGAKLR